MISAFRMNWRLEKLVFTGQKIGGLMTNAMPVEKAKNWFGAAPPDLTMITRFKSPEYVYNYLKTFYVDDTRPFGVEQQGLSERGHAQRHGGPAGDTARNGCVQKPKIAANGGQMRDPLIPGKAITEEKCDELYVEEGTGQYTAEEFDQAGSKGFDQLLVLRRRAQSSGTTKNRHLCAVVPGHSRLLYLLTKQGILERRALIPVPRLSTFTLGITL